MQSDVGVACLSKETFYILEHSTSSTPTGQTYFMCIVFRSNPIKMNREKEQKSNYHDFLHQGSQIFGFDVGFCVHFSRISFLG